MYPEANGLVERFHRQLKSAIIATSSNLNWVKRLPIILLSIRSTVKEDLGCCPEGTCIRHNHKTTWRNVCPLPRPNSHGSSVVSAHIPKDLSSCLFVFVRMDTVKKPLQPPYDGPYKVLQRKPKYFILDRKGSKDSVSIDRLEPAYLEPPTKLAPIVGTQLSKDTVPSSSRPLQTFPMILQSV
nr:gag pol polyprotein [Hymenolepis microstoma]CDS32428.1 gag pol polyprotein [Hymenolepis microstoma]